MEQGYYVVSGCPEDIVPELQFRGIGPEHIGSVWVCADV